MQKVSDIISKALASEVSNQEEDLKGLVNSRDFLMARKLEVQDELDSLNSRIYDIDISIADALNIIDQIKVEINARPTKG